MSEIGEIQDWITDAKSLHRAIISGRRKSHHPTSERIDIRPVVIRDELYLQLVSHDGKRDQTRNVKPGEFNISEILVDGYANIRIEKISEDIDIKITKKGKFKVHRKAHEIHREVDLSHNRNKERRLKVSDSIFQVLGISDKEGNLIPRQSDKFHQVDDFLRIIDQLIPDLGSGEISIIDLGCGNAYLTFAVHKYLTHKGLTVKVTGVDTRLDSRERNSKIAESAGISDSVSFIASSISDFPITPTSLVIALHACDTATDDALAYAVRAGAKAILVSPCCHHDLNQQISAPDDPWKILLRHGITKERFADLMTDSLRAEILRLLGYRADIIEFVSLDHTARNLMIRAVRSNSVIKRSDFDNFEEQIKRWSIKPYLQRELAREIAARRSTALS
jgi:SAM-dependent methyltransferase